MYKTQCSRLTGLFGVSIKEKGLKAVVGCGPRCLLQHHRRDPSAWLTYQHLTFLKRQYVAKSIGELHQRAAPKQAPVDESDTAAERRVRRVPAIESVVSEGASTSSAAEDRDARETSGVKTVTTTTTTTSHERPHVHVETDEARDARLDRQWKRLKVDVADLPDVYARLAKIKLTALVVMTAAAGYAMAPVPFDPVIFLVSSLGTGLASSAANTINQPTPRRDLRPGVRRTRSGPADLGGEPADGLPGRPQHRPVHVLLHAAQEAHHRQHVGGRCGGRHTARHGLDGCHGLPGCRCAGAGGLPVQLAVPPLQRAQLEPKRGLLARRLSHDVSHTPGHVPARGPASQRGAGGPLRPGTGSGRHHVDLPRRGAAHQRLHQPPGIPLLPAGRPRQRPQAVLLQPVAPAHAAAAGAHLQDASPGTPR
ncbi:uncharacterized protein LOC129168193 isoform X2 [Dunckerocampus dactyliophorus]|uniref:uncharacterized protein LOC129168193 isoform X2 n=1 Tax=Dunckerocampus dactyliophorus TaxID=161453 RepID=UPI002406C5FD|nr:uncharacterized protein LOC129168193 isoform X2 [Dunckerocampus dactyliophorus]